METKEKTQKARVTFICNGKPRINNAESVSMPWRHNEICIETLLFKNYESVSPLGAFHI